MSIIDSDTSEVMIDLLREYMNDAMDDDLEVGIFRNKDLVNGFKQLISYVEDHGKIICKCPQCGNRFINHVDGSVDAFIGP